MSEVVEGLSRREAAKGARISPEGPAFGPGRDTLSSGRSLSSAPGSPSGSVHSLSSLQDLGLDDRWLIHPNLLFVGPKIGEGAHGKVYEGKYRQQTVAIKIIQPGQVPEERARREARFNREVTLLSRIKHKNLVKFVGACKEPVMVVVTEILQGGSLRKYLMSLRPKCLELRVAINFALDIAKALECLHKHGIIHRDLKPDNLLLTVDLKTVKLVDFGLAREETLEMMTSETGTYRWMAPELYSTVTLRHGEKKHYNHKVDVYSFSIVLWELLTNRMPFEGMSNLQAAYAAAFRGTRPTISESLGLSEELIFILQSCWAEDPDLRPNFSEIVRMLTSFLSMLSPAPPNHLTCKTVAPANDQLPASGPFKQKVEERSDDSSNVNSPSKPSRKSVLSCLGHCFLSGTQESLM